MISGLIFYRRITFPTDNDYNTHIHYAYLILRGIQNGDISDVPALNLAHPGLQVLLVVLFIFPFRMAGLHGALILVLTGTQILTALILYFGWFENRHLNNNQWQRLFWSLTLSFVAPVMLLQLLDNKFYFGYIGLANYHNPTVVMLRPLALLSFLLASRMFTNARSSNGSIIFSAVLIVLSALIKPNYALTILLALAGMVSLYWLAKKNIDWRMLIYGFVLPAVITLALQWVFLFLVSAEAGEGIFWMPFEVESGFSEYLFPKFFLSILFPLSVYLIYFRDVIKKSDMQLAGLTFLAGAAQMYLLAEGGERLFHGNFRWSAQIALFLLFAVSARYIYHQTVMQKMKGKLIPVVLYMVHLLAGAAYYLHTLFLSGYG
jgi:hypothetical protein